MAWITRALILLTLMASAVMVNAQETDPYPVEEAIPSGPNNPYVNENANACYIGGSLSGKCNTTDVNGDKVVDDYDRDWMWTAGWHRIRYDYGMVEPDNFDEAYAPILPEPEGVRQIDGMDAGCYEVIFEGVPERWILWGGGASVQTAELYFRDTCDGPLFYLENVVAVETYEEADEICKRDLGKHLYPDRFASSFWYCVYYRPDFTTYPDTGASTEAETESGE